VIALLVACVAPDGAGAVGDAAGDTGAASPDTGGPTDSAADTGDTAHAACPDALDASVDGVALAGAVDFGAPPAWTEAVTVPVTLTSRCSRRVRLLGHPDDWVTGDSFSLGALPDVYLDPGGSTALELILTPGAEGPASGAFALPHDGGDGALALALSATVDAPLRVLLVGDGAHRLTTADYGATAVYEAWTTTEPHTVALLRGACAGPGLFVAVGGNAERVTWTSADGEAWEERVESGAPIGDCAWADGRYVAFDGAPLMSTDGAAWTRGDGSLAHHLRAMTAGEAPDGRAAFVAVGDGGQIAVTSDGAGWDVDQVLPGGAGFTEVAYGDGVFVAAGADGATAASADGGATWVESGSGGAAARGLVYADGLFFLGDGASIFASSDGVAWSAVNAAPAAPLAVVGSRLIGTDGATIYTSDDGGFTWDAGVAAAGGLELGDAAVEVRE